jgi:hypothetical protein
MVPRLRAGGEPALNLMSLHQKLIDIRLAKGEYHHLQKRFYAELAVRFPYIMTRDMKKLSMKLSEEMDIFLCACLKYKSTRIELETEKKKWRAGTHGVLPVIVSRKPGMRYKHSEIKDIDLIDRRLFFKSRLKLYSKYLKKEDDSISKRMMVDFMPMTTHGSVHQDKFQDFVDLQHDIVKSLPDIYGYIPSSEDHNLNNLYYYNPYHYSDTMNPKEIDGKTINQCYGEAVTDNLILYFLPRSICFNLLSDKKDEDESNSHEVSIRCPMEGITDYGSDEEIDYLKHRPMQNPLHTMLKEIISNFDRIREIMEKTEKHKQETYVQCMSYMKRAKKVTTPFKVLNELL